MTLSLMWLCTACAGVAQAAPETIGEFGEGAGQVRFPTGVAIDRSTGDLYVSDANNFRIDKFDPELPQGERFLLAAGLGVRDGTATFQTCGPQAVPPTVACRRGLQPELGGVSPEAVAVDSSGDVYVSGNHRVIKFSSAGVFVFMVGKNVNKTKVALGGGATQAEKDLCSASSGDSCGQAESGTGSNEFSGTSLPLAVDSAGVVWVGDTARLISFDSAGAPGAEIALTGGEVKSLALDSSANFFVRSESVAGVRKLEAGTNVLLETLDAGGQARPVTLDEADNVYIGDATSPYRFKVYNSAGERISEFGAGQVIGAPGDGFFGTNAIAVDGVAGKLYAASSKSSEAESVVQAFPLPEPGPLVVSQGVEDLEPTTATLTATLNPEGAQTTYHFEYGTEASYGHSTPTQTLTAEGFDSEDVKAQIGELIPDTTYHFRLVATNHCNSTEPAEECTAQGEDQTFTTLPAVDIVSQWATDVTAHTAFLHAEMDTLGVEAEAWLEYGTDESYGQTVPLANLGDGFGAVTRQALLAGLQAATTYHYRFAARDERDGAIYIVHGADRSFTTQFGGLGFDLGDNRVWEMVSPPDKHGASLIGGGIWHLQAAADGDGLDYPSMLSTEADPEGNRIIETSTNLARRNADGSWRSKDITPPNNAVTGYAPGSGSEYQLFSSDLSEALLEPRSGTPLSPEASERTPYLRENSEPGSFRPLVTGKEPYANVPPGTEFGGTGKLPAVSVVGASPNFRHFALSSALSVSLIDGAPISQTAVYEWSSGQIKPVSVLPAAEGGALIGGAAVGSGRYSVRGAVSEDGSRIFWSAESSGHLSALYVRDTAAEESARLDVVQSGASGSGTAQPIFQGASADGSVVFFTDSQQLTEDASLKGSDLYRCELPPAGGSSGCATLTDISVPSVDGDSARLEGLAAAVSEDGQAIYFVARGVLDDAPNQYGDSAVAGGPNLYLWQQGQGARFIATLAGADRSDWGDPIFAFKLSAAASPSGRYLAFMSQGSLTGYDNRDATTGEPAQEVFRYDALTQRLACVSCNPAGERPDSTATPEGQSLVNPVGDLWQGQRTAAILPEATMVSVGGISLYRPRAVLDNGRVFFNAIDPLVPADSNGQWDAYEDEPVGVGDCTASSGGASISRSAGGCVSLLSSGTAEEEAAFLDAGETGDDAFFWTPAQLSVLDEDHEVDVYDARVDGIAATLPNDAECLGEACQPLAQAPNDPTPASAAFRGAGNVHPSAGKHCPKGKRRVRRHGRVRCVARRHHRRRDGHREHRKAGGDRRAAR
ncbi:MAG TPA: NHL repeat-containing protein [Solirubrobacterales bacterium]|nr:NHL repeat-containing protein [Solirubrobacterales bacterium]